MTEDFNAKWNMQELIAHYGRVIAQDGLQPKKKVAVDVTVGSVMNYVRRSMRSKNVVLRNFTMNIICQRVLVTCNFCGHELTNNLHGVDQDDFRLRANGSYEHSGRCAYCKECNPAMKELDEETQ